MLTLRKQVADFCFLDDYDRSDGEPLVSYGMCHIIPREDILTFRPDKMVTTTIIEYWSLLLNELEYQEKHQPSRVFFGVSHMLPLESIMENKNLGNAIEELYDCWDMWNHLNAHNLNLNANMIFIPLLAEQHFFCVCVNFKSRRLEYLDNRKYDCWMERDSTMMCKTVCEHMCAYLKGKSIVRPAEISSFDIVNVEFQWQSSEDNNLDCGVFLMLHMLFYNNEVFDCPLSSPRSRILYRCELAASLVLSDLNELRADVLKIVESFKDEKRTFWPKLQQKRKEIHERKLKEKKLLARSRKKSMKGDDGALSIRVITPATPKHYSSLAADMLDPPCGTHSSAKSLINSSVSILRSMNNSESDGAGCSLYWPSGVNVFFVSKFMRSNKTMLMKILELRKKVLDYCFLDDYELDNGECLASFSKLQFLVKEDFLTLLPDKMMVPRVADCWSVLLNAIEAEENAPPSKLFFGIHHRDCLSNLLQKECDTRVNDILFDMWTSFFDHCPVPMNFNADLVFVPLQYNNHYYAVCVNHIEKKIEVLDNTSHKDWHDSDFYKLVKALSGPLSDFLDTKGRQIGDDAWLFDEIESVRFAWQGLDRLDAESGCFMMMHMLFFEGGTFECDLGSKKSRRIFLTEMAAALLLSDINLDRERIVSQALKLQSTKEKLWPLLRTERQREEQELKKKVVKRRKKQPSEIKEPQPLITEIPVAHYQRGVRGR